MVAESPDITVPAVPTHGLLTAAAEVLPLWNDSWVKHIPLIGRLIVTGMNAGRYETTLEQNADFIAGDLESEESKWSGMLVGVIDESKKA